MLGQGSNGLYSPGNVMFSVKSCKTRIIQYLLEPQTFICRVQFVGYQFIGYCLSGISLSGIVCRVLGYFVSHVIIFWQWQKSNTHCVKSFQIRNYGPCFLAFGLSTEIYLVNLGIQSEYRKMRLRNNSVFGRFSRSGCQ